MIQQIRCASTSSLPTSTDKTMAHKTNTTSTSIFDQAIRQVRPPVIQANFVFHLASSPSESEHSPPVSPSPSPAAFPSIPSLGSSALNGSTNSSCPQVFFCAKAMKSSRVTSPGKDLDCIGGGRCGGMGLGRGWVGQCPRIQKRQRIGVNRKCGAPTQKDRCLMAKKSVIKNLFFLEMPEISCKFSEVSGMPMRFEAPTEGI